MMVGRPADAHDSAAVGLCGAIFSAIQKKSGRTAVMKRTCRECQNQLLNSCGMAAASVSDLPAKWLGGRGGDGSPVSKPAVVKQRAVIDWVWSYELYPPIARADYSISPKLFLNV